jgi:hypothetical protein
MGDTIYTNPNGQCCFSHTYVVIIHEGVSTSRFWDKLSMGGLVEKFQFSGAEKFGRVCEV